MTLRHFAKVVSNRALTATPLPRLLHARVYPHEVTILTYHAVVQSLLGVEDPCFIDVRTFEAQIAYMKEHFLILPLASVCGRLENEAIDRPTAAITFDDGYQNNYDFAFPVLRRYGVPATIFLATSLIDSGESLWFCRLLDALSRTKQESMHWSDRAFALSGAKARAQTSAALQDAVKRYPAYQIPSVVNEICRAMDIEPDPLIRDGSPYQMLRSQSIKTMVRSGLVECGAHTHTHPILSSLSLEEQEREIVRSIKTVSELCGQPCRLFAYPNGRPEDYNQGSMDILVSSGVAAACTTIPGPNVSSTPKMQLRRYGTRCDFRAFVTRVHHITNRAQQVMEMSPASGPAG